MDIAVIGGGIAGLSAAIALRRSGHKVTVYEKSRFSSEVGAAISVPPNAVRELLRWGFDMDRAKATPKSQLRILDGTSLSLIREENYRDCSELFGAPWYSLHRVDMHSELRRLAIEEKGEGTPVELFLERDILDMDCELGTITSKTEAPVRKDLIVLANGVHCSLQHHVTQTPVITKDTNLVTYRALVPMEDIMQHDNLRSLFQDQDPGFLNFFLPAKQQIVITFPARNGTLLHVGCMRIADPSSCSRHVKDWNQDASKNELLELVEGFHPTVVELAKLCDEVKCYSNVAREPLETIHRGRVVIIGDAAHPMSPKLVQGAAQAIEEAAALGAIFAPGSRSEEVMARLNLYPKARRARGQIAALFSNHWWTMPREQFLQKLRCFDPEFPDLPTPLIYGVALPVRRLFHSYDARAEATKVLADAGFHGCKDLYGMFLMQLKAIMSWMSRIFATCFGKPKKA
ncbi:hypothetical protein FKW77_001718 [Venturia effusa]|uniref:FAD-binding domain-containing protein n=1 Tax=Venturia effusa TaxID=50376 RepID=A0A517KZ32_9PEZI|nr:hypothetical protein FKW77_001718 [Venturia effusa]